MLVTGFPAGALAANCYVLAPGPDAGCVVVDPGQDSLPRLQEVLRANRLRPQAVLLTHGHPDHVWAANEACREFDVPAYLHPDDRPMLTDPAGWLSPDLARLLLAERSSWTEPPRVMVPDDGERLALAGMSITATHTAGHTGGSVTYRVDREPEGLTGDPAGGPADSPADDPPALLLSGDLLFAGSIGRTDLPGGDHPTMLASLTSHVCGLDDRIAVLPGHGPSTTIGRERSTNPFLLALSPAHPPQTGQE